MLIGLSVSKCIKDIIEGKIDVDQVAYIISSIDPTWKNKPVETNLDGIISIYGRKYGPWRSDPELGEMIFRYLWRESRILCPRMTFDKESFPPLLDKGNGHWLACEQVNTVEEYYGKPVWQH